MNFRNYQGAEDLDLQEKFWIEVTRALPWCWKRTTSPNLYANSAQFDPRSRRFAFEGDRLVGYMSFTGQAEFVSLGYPWVLPGYEGELQQQLWDAVYGFAASQEYGGRTFAQRFRRPWTAQIDFFKQHGFAELRVDPLYALDLRGQMSAQTSGPYRVEIQLEFHWEEFEPLAAIRSPAEQLEMFKLYFQTVDFDFATRATRHETPVAYLGFAIRSDTGFAELIAAGLDPRAEDAITSCLLAAVGTLRSRNALLLATKPIPGESATETLIAMGFRKVSEEVLLSKSI